MERLKLIFMVMSLVFIALCFGAGVWLYVEGFGMMYMLMFFVALVWYIYVFGNYWKQR